MDSGNEFNRDHLVIMNLRLIEDRGECHEVNCWLVPRRPEPHFIGTGILRGLAHLRFQIWQANVQCSLRMQSRVYRKRATADAGAHQRHLPR